MPSINAIRSPPSQTVTPTAATKPGLGPPTLRLDRASQDLGKLITRERLPDHELAPHEPTGLDGIDLGEARRVYDSKIRPRSNQSLGNPGTPPVREIDIHQDHVDVALVPFDHLGRLLGRGCTDHVESALPQETSRDLADRLLVIDKENDWLSLEFFGLLV